MSIKNTITSNSITSATIGDKTLTRRTEGGQVIYDAAGSGGSGGSSIPVTYNGASRGTVTSIAVNGSATQGGYAAFQFNSTEGSFAFSANVAESQ